MGVSRKALRLYEAQGLIRPERTGADWRIYGPEEIARLHQILALKRFGFPLARIADVLTGQVADISGFLEFHLRVAETELAQAQRAVTFLPPRGASSTGKVIFRRTISFF